MRSVRYTYRLRVSAGSERLLVAEWDRCRWVWNRCVEESKKAHELSTPEHRVTCGPAELDKMLTGWRAEHEWLGMGSSVAQQQVVRDFGTARAKALSDAKARVPVQRRRGLPTFKAKKLARPTLNYTRRGFSLHQDETGRLRLHLAGRVVVCPVWSRELPSVPSSVRVYRDACATWWCSFVVDVDDEPLAQTGKVVGIDWGVRVIATATDPAFDYLHPEHMKRAAGRLAHYQRQMARREPARGKSASAGYKKAKTHAAKLHRTVARQRQDAARKWAKAVVREFDQIAAEDFCPKFLSRTTMAKKAADAAIASAKAELAFMALKHGRELHLVPPAYTTMDCSRCGTRAKARLELSERTYTCWSCGTTVPRDRNAAAVMVARAGLNPAGAESVRPGSPQRTRAA